MKIMILYTLNVERTLEAHVQTDFISRLRFFLYKIDPEPDWKIGESQLV